MKPQVDAGKADQKGDGEIKPLKGWKGSGEEKHGGTHVGGMAGRKRKGVASARRSYDPRQGVAGPDALNQVFQNMTRTLVRENHRHQESQKQPPAPGPTPYELVEKKQDNYQKDAGMVKIRDVGEKGIQVGTRPTLVDPPE